MSSPCSAASPTAPLPSSSFDLLFSLPCAVSGYCFSFLDLKSLLRCLYVSHSLHSLIQSQSSAWCSSKFACQNQQTTIHAVLTRLPHIHHLFYKHHYDFDHDDITAIAKSHSVSSLHLNKTGLDDDSIAFLATALQVNSSLRVVDLSFNKIGAGGATSLAAAFLANTNIGIQTLDLSNNVLGDSGIRALVNAISARHFSVTAMDVSNCGIRRAGAEALAEALKRNGSLLKLSMHSNDVGDVGMNVLVSSLQDNYTLTNVDLHNTGLGVQSILSLVHVLRVHKSLEELDVSGNADISSTDDSAIRALIVSLQCGSSSLRRLSLRNLPFVSARWCRAMVRTMIINPLVRFDFDADDDLALFASAATNDDEVDGEKEDIDEEERRKTKGRSSGSSSCSSRSRNNSAIVVPSKLRLSRDREKILQFLRDAYNHHHGCIAIQV